MPMNHKIWMAVIIIVVCLIVWAYIDACYYDGDNDDDWPKNGLT